MASIRFDRVTKRYGDGAAAVSDLDLEIRDGEFMVLVGPSGCGKSTALRMIAGLEEISAGRLLIGDRLANHASPRDRDIAMVFQSYALYPHLSVAENMGFGLKVRGLSTAEIRRKVDEVSRVLELGEYLSRRPGQLSGGQRQRVAMGRALVRSPNALLMDEPLSNLDARLRGQMRAEIAQLQSRTGVTTVYVTHDQVEAMTMGHRVAVMQRGRLQQLASPRELYDRPRNLFVAGFIGAPGMNFMTGTLDRAEGAATVRLGDHVLALPAPLDRVDQATGLDVVVGVRPEAFRIAEDAGPGTLSGTVGFVEDLGAVTLAHVALDGPQVVRSAELVADDFTAGPLRLRAMLDAALEVRPGARIRLAVDPARIVLFDPRTTLALLS